MKLGILSDTHQDKMNAIPYIIREFKKNGVEVIIHCGDIIETHVKPELFGNLPVFCALTDEQEKDMKENTDSKFPHPQDNWLFTYPNKRVVDVGETRCYIGHKRSFEILLGSELKLMETLDFIRRDYDNVEFVYSGHTHHQILMQSRRIVFINPGAVEDSLGIAGGAEYVIIDTKEDQIMFSRILPAKSVKKELKLGIISDSFDISEMDTIFWKRLAQIFQKNNVTHIIHCGNISLNDIGKEELSPFQVFYNLRPDQRSSLKEKDNWHLISSEKPVVDIDGYQFYVQLDLGPEFLDQSEIGMHRLSLTIQKQHPEIKFILYGLTHDAFYEEGQNLILLNPGDVVRDKDYAIIALPQYEITFGRILDAPFSFLY